jgi:glycosyltransferase involved in cell wall biosynthesis
MSHSVRYRQSDRTMITAAICTLNRAESLRRTLESLAAMRVPDDVEWEVVVVNNGSTDHTDAVVAAFAGRLPIRREFEPQRGLSRARNRAVDAARGDYIVWTDDDVIVDRGWLAAYVEAFRRWPEAAVFGGRIIPRYEPPVPRWLSENESVFFGMLALRDFGDAEQPLSLARLPYGPNFAVCAAAQQAFRYDLQLGHGPAQRRRGEEIDVVERILQSGATGYWVPRAKVEHCFSRGQQTIPYAIRFFATIGETEALLRENTTTSGVFWLGAPRWLWRRMIEEWVRYRFHRWFSPTPVWVRYLRDYSTTWGRIRYWRSQRG